LTWNFYRNRNNPGIGGVAPATVDGTAALAYRKLMQVKSAIVEKLTAAFAPQSLDVIDESHRHEGHAGHRPGGQTHFRVHIVSEAFRGKSRVERHRMVNQALADELAAGVHALAIQAGAPGENGAS
jgi:BolA protein